MFPRGRAEVADELDEEFKGTFMRIVACLLMLFSLTARADVTCTISDYLIDAYDHKGVYLHGNVNGTWVNFIVLCGLTNGVQDCDSKATDRRLAIALSAQVTGRSLIGYFIGPASCAAVPAYSNTTLLRVSP